MSETGLDLALFVTVVTPFALLALLAVGSLVPTWLTEARVGALTRAAMLVSFASVSAALVAFAGRGGEAYVLSLGAWFAARGSAFAFDFLVDWLSLAFATLSIAISGVVSVFSHRYLHREPGFRRYFVLFAVFVAGITLVALAGSIEVLFAGWELLGLSSALLVGFFWERRTPVVNAFRVFAVYRVSDAAMLSAAVLLHHWAGSGSLALLFSGRADAALSTAQAAAIAVLLVVAVAGKSALLPFSGWLSRAMEGPTPSSAVFYGALSIHAGCFLLLRAEPLLAQSPVARFLALGAGAATALYATAVSRAQSDVKSKLAYASLSQVGLIVAEISVGLTTFALVHMVGHASFRLLQFLTAPNVLHWGARPAPGGAASARSAAWHLAALERGFVDALVDRALVAPFLALVAVLDRFDRLLCGQRGGPHD